MEETLNTVRNRPRFKLQTTLTPDEFTEKLKLNLAKENDEFEGSISSQESFVEVKTIDDPVWKPRLTLRAEIDEFEGTTVIRGIFGPKSSIWTFFMFIYIIFGTSAIVFGCLYYSLKIAKATNDRDFNWAGSATVFCLIAILLTYIAAKIGQAKSKKDIIKLREFAENIVVIYEKEEKNQI